MTSEISDHLPIFFIYSDYFNENTVKPNKYSYRVISDEILSNIYDKVASSTFSYVVERRILKSLNLC